jgi:hypothetical protein
MVLIYLIFDLSYNLKLSTPFCKIKLFLSKHDGFNIKTLYSKDIVM